MQAGKAGLNVCRFGEGEKLDIYGGGWGCLRDAAESDPDFVSGDTLSGQDLDELKGRGTDQGVV